MVLKARDYFDPRRYEKRALETQAAWSELIEGKRSHVVFLNLCAPFLCHLFGVELCDYYTNFAVMAETQMRGIAWRLEHLEDDEVPLAIFLDQGTVHEAIAFDLPVDYRPGSTPWGRPLITDIAQVDALTVPSFAGQRSLLETRHKLNELRSLVQGLPVLTSVHLHAPFTMAVQLYNAQDLFLACYEEPQRVHKLLDYCVQAYLHFERVKWQYGISPEPLDEFVCWREPYRGMTRVWLSDDTASMLSPGLYAEFSLPYNRALFAHFELIHLHMDGRWDQLIPAVASLRPSWCEVGGETDWPAVVGTLGPTTLLQGGILAEIARDGTADDCFEAASRALAEARGRARVALTVANEVHPGTPLSNLQAIIEAARRFE